MLLCPNKFGVCVCAMVVSSEVDAGDYSPNETPLMQTLSIVLGCHSTSRISNIFQTYPRISIFSKSSVISCDVISLYIIYIHVYIRIYIYYIYIHVYIRIYIYKSYVQRDGHKTCEWCCLRRPVLDLLSAFVFDPFADVQKM